MDSIRLLAQKEVEAANKNAEAKSKALEKLKDKQAKQQEAAQPKPAWQLYDTLKKVFKKFCTG